jgi:hypothetical protein
VVNVQANREGSRRERGASFVPGDEGKAEEAGLVW